MAMGLPHLTQMWTCSRDKDAEGRTRSVSKHALQGTEERGGPRPAATVASQRSTHRGVPVRKIGFKLISARLKAYHPKDGD